MAIEGALVKPVVDALMGIFNKARKSRLKQSAEKQLTEAITELLAINPNQALAEAKIKIAKAAGIINSDMLVAERMLEKVKSTPKFPAKSAVKAVPKKAAHAKKAKKANAVSKKAVSVSRKSAKHTLKAKKK